MAKGHSDEALVLAAGANHNRGQRCRRAFLRTVALRGCGSAGARGSRVVDAAAQAPVADKLVASVVAKSSLHQ